MYEKYTRERILEKSKKDGYYNVYELDIKGTEIICIPNGDIYRRMKTGFWKLIENKCNHNKGYNVILIKNHQYTRAKIILYSQNKIDINTKNINIYHKNGDRLDCHIDNLTIEVPKLIRMDRK